MSEDQLAENSNLQLTLIRRQLESINRTLTAIGYLIPIDVFGLLFFR
jgi:hypothetical protein